MKERDLDFTILKVRPKQATKSIAITAHIRPNHETKVYGDILMGLPACVDLGLSLVSRNVVIII